ARRGRATAARRGLVLVEAAAALAAEEAGVRHRDEPRRCGHPRLAKLLPQRLARVDVDVDADEVEQLAGAHRPAGAVLHAGVEVAVGEIGELRGQGEAGDGGVARVLLEPALVDLAGQEVRDAVVRVLPELDRDLAADRLEAGLHAELCDAGAHRAEPDDAYL